MQLLDARFWCSPRARRRRTATCFRGGVNTATVSWSRSIPSTERRGASLIGRSRRNGKRRGTSGGERLVAHDEIWCVFDIDEHPNVHDAIQKADTNGIRLAISNPCIELWFILHFEDQTAFLDRHAAQSQSSTLLECGKTLTSEATGILYETFEPARDRAIALDRKHEGDRAPVGSNPSSGVWTLIESIRA